MTHRILFVNQEMTPFLPETSLVRKLNLELPAYMQSHGFDTRSFMPKFHEVSDRRNQLHEVIRLSGINVVINDYDHPLVIKVASLMRKKIQVYFTDSRDYFHYPRKNNPETILDDINNGDRCIFFAQSVLETVKKLCWSPDIICCSGWMSALVPLYIKKSYCKTPFFKNSKVVISIDNNTFTTPLNTKFASNLIIDGVLKSDLRSIAGFELYYEDIMRFAIDFSDAVVFAEPCSNTRLLNYADTTNKPVLYGDADCAKYKEFYLKLLGHV